MFLNMQPFNMKGGEYMSGVKIAKLVINILMLVFAIITFSVFINWTNGTASLKSLGIVAGITAVIVALRVLVKDALD